MRTMIHQGHLEMLNNWPGRVQRVSVFNPGDPRTSNIGPPYTARQNDRIIFLVKFKFPSFTDGKIQAIKLECVFASRQTIHIKI